MLYSSTSKIFLAAMVSAPMCCLGLQVRAGGQHGGEQLPASLLRRSASNQEESVTEAAPNAKQSVKSRASSLSCIEDSLNQIMREKEAAAKKLIDEMKTAAPKILVAKFIASVDTPNQQDLSEAIFGIIQQKLFNPDDATIIIQAMNENLLSRDTEEQYDKFSKYVTDAADVVRQNQKITK